MPPHHPKAAECREWEALLRRHASRLARFPGNLFSVCYHEGSAAAQNKAREIIRRGHWLPPWLRMEHVVFGAVPEGTQEVLDVQVRAEVRYDHPSVSCVAPERSVAFRTTTLGNVGVGDLSMGRMLPTRISVGRRRVLRLACSPNAKFLAAAYEDGRGDLFAVDLDVTTGRVIPRHLAEFVYLVPRQEAPCIRCTNHDFWYQNASGQIASTVLDAAGYSPNTLRLPALEPGEEVSGIEPWGNGLAVTVRKGRDGRVCLSLPGREPAAYPFERATPTALCPVDEELLAVALSSARTSVLCISQSITEATSFVTDEVSIAMTSHDKTLVGVTEMGVIWSADLSTPIARVRYGRRSPALLGAESLHHASADSFILAAAAGATRFSLASDSVPKATAEFSEVMPGQEEGEAMAVCRKAGSTWLVRTDHPDEVTVANQIGLRTYAYDRRTRVFLACDFGDSSVEVDVAAMKRGRIFRLPSDARCAADVDGGFWVFVPPAALYYLAESGACRKVADMGLDVAGPVQMHCWDATPPILTVEAPCRVWTKMGSDVYHTLCFYTVGESLLGHRTLKKIGAWSIHAAEGLPEAWVYIPVLKQFAIRLADRFCVGSPQNLVSGNGASFTDANLSEKCLRATVVPGSTRVFLVGASGTLYLVDVARRGLVAVYSGTSAVSQIASDSVGRSVFAILDRTSLATFHLEEQV